MLNLLFICDKVIDRFGIECRGQEENNSTVGHNTRAWPQSDKRRHDALYARVHSRSASC